MHPAGEHRVCFSRVEAGHQASLADFVASSLNRREAVVCIGFRHEADGALKSLRDRGCDIESAVEGGQIALLSADAVLSDDGDLIPDGVVRWVDRRCEQALSEGYPFLSVTIEMSAILERFGPASVAELESLLQVASERQKWHTTSRYDLLRTDPAQLLGILRTTPTIEIDGEIFSNIYYTPARDLRSPHADAIWFNQLIDTIKERDTRDTLQESADILTGLFSEIDVGFALFKAQKVEGNRDPAFTAIQTNPVLAEINGLSDNEIIGKDARDIFPVDAPEIIEILGEVAATGVSARFERYQEGMHRYFEVIAFRPRPELCAALVTEITDRKRLEETRQRSEFRIRQTQKMEAIGRLASGVAHDFNNILTAIVGFTNVLMDEIPRDWPQWGDIEEIGKAAERAASLTRQLLAFSRKQKISPKVIQLNHTIERSLLMLSRIMGEDVRVRFEPGAELHPVKIDPTQVEQILINFSANARDALPNGGELRLSTRNETVTEARLSTHGEILPGEYVVLAARDNGTGMTDEVLDRLFEPFFTTKGKGKGTGLGLATVYGIVRQNRGTITVDSNPGDGTAFEIYFPWARTGVIDSVPQEKRTSRSGSGVILVAEDEETVRSLTVRILERTGYTVIAAEDGKKALSAWEKTDRPVDLVITDVVMPGMNGVELYRTLKSRDENLRFLFMSGYPEDVIQQHGMPEDAVSLLEKPFSPDALIARIEDILKQS